MAECYIIFSKKLNRFYTGVTQENVQNRILKHNNHSYGEQRFTAKADDWTLYLLIQCPDYKQALKIEKRIKKMKSVAYIKNLKLFPELIVKLKSI